MRLTLPGGLTAAVSAALLVAAYVLGYPRLAVLGVGGLAALATGVASAARRPALEMTREVFPSRVQRGEPAVGMLTITNHSRLAGARIEARDAFGDQELAVPVPYLRGGACREIGYQLPTGHRGVFDVGPLRWERADMLGLVRRQQALAGRQRLYVHPVAHQFPLGAALRAQRWDSSTSDAAPDGTITFHSLREYVPGDDLRYIHWRSSAKLDTLMVRRNIDVSLPRTTMLLVTGSSAYPDQALFEEAVEVAASAVLAAARERLPARLLTSEGEVLAGSGGHEDVRLFLDFLAGARLRGNAGLGPAADILEGAEGGGVLVAAAGVLDEQDLATLRRIAARYDETVVALLGRRADGSPAGTGSPDALGDLAVTVLAVASAAELCARWGELARR